MCGAAYPGSPILLSSLYSTLASSSRSPNTSSATSRRLRHTQNPHILFRHVTLLKENMPGRVGIVCSARVTRHKTTWFRYCVWSGARPIWAHLLFSSSLYSPIASSSRTVTHKTHTYSSGVLCENTSGRVAWVWYCVQRSLAGLTYSLASSSQTPCLSHAIHNTQYPHVLFSHVFL